MDPPGTIRVLAVEANDTSTRALSTFVFKLNLPSGTVVTTNTLNLDFPEEWEMIIHYKKP